MGRGWGPGMPTTPPGGCGRGRVGGNYLSAMTQTPWQVFEILRDVRDPDGGFLGKRHVLPAGSRFFQRHGEIGSVTSATRYPVESPVGKALLAAGDGRSPTVQEQCYVLGLPYAFLPIYLAERLGRELDQAFLKEIAEEWLHSWEVPERAPEQELPSTRETL